VRAPASIFWTVSQSQAEPTSAGHMRTAILIHRERPAGPIKIFWTVGGAPLVIEQASIDINMVPHSAYAKVRHLEADVPTHRKTGTFANAAGAY
jgi:hypothetical protein